MKYGIKIVENKKIICEFMDNVLGEGFFELSKNEYLSLRDKIMQDPFGVYDFNTKEYINETEEAKAIRLTPNIKQQEREIDKNTRRLISKGFSFDGYTFSMSQNAQLTWNLVFWMLQDGTFPAEGKKIFTKEKTKYILAFSNARDFCNAYKEAIKVVEDGVDQKDILLNS